MHEDDRGLISIGAPGSKTWVKLNEPYLTQRDRLADSEHFNKTWHVPKGDYFMIGDHRGGSSDSRSWGAVPKANLIGPVGLRAAPQASQNLASARFSCPHCGHRVTGRV